MPSTKAAAGRWPVGAGEARALQRFVTILVAVVIIVWIVSDPSAAGNTVHSWVTGIITFFQHLVV